MIWIYCPVLSVTWLLSGLCRLHETLACCQSLLQSTRWTNGWDSCMLCFWLRFVQWIHSAAAPEHLVAVHCSILGLIILLHVFLSLFLSLLCLFFFFVARIIQMRQPVSTYCVGIFFFFFLFFSTDLINISPRLLVLPLSRCRVITWLAS